MKSLAMHITNQKLSFDKFMVGNLLNIFMEHDHIEISIIVGYCYKHTHATHDWFCGPGSHMSLYYPRIHYQ